DHQRHRRPRHGAHRSERSVVHRAGGGRRGREHHLQRRRRSGVEGQDQDHRDRDRLRSGGRVAFDGGTGADARGYDGLYRARPHAHRTNRPARAAHRRSQRRAAHVDPAPLDRRPAAGRGRRRRAGGRLQHGCAGRQGAAWERRRPPQSDRGGRRHRHRALRRAGVPAATGRLVARTRRSRTTSRAGHPGWLRCSSFKYSRYSQSSRLAIRAPRSAIWSLFTVYGPLAPSRARGIIHVMRAWQLVGGAMLVVASGAIAASTSVTLEVADVVPMPITGTFDGKGQTDGMLARVNSLRQEPAGAPVGASRLFLHALNAPLFTLNKPNKTFPTYLDFNGRDGHTGLFHKLSFDTGFAGGFVSFQFDPDYVRNGRFYSVHIEDPALPGSNLPDNAHVRGLSVTGYAVTPPVT